MPAATGIVRCGVTVLFVFFPAARAAIVDAEVDKAGALGVSALLSVHDSREPYVR
jgi:hypothetical protein